MPGLDVGETRTLGVLWDPCGPACLSIGIRSVFSNLFVGPELRLSGSFHEGVSQDPESLARQRGNPQWFLHNAASFV